MHLRLTVPTYGVRVSTESLTVAEGGSGAFTVALTGDPGSNLTVGLYKAAYRVTSSGSASNANTEDLDAASLSPSTLSFTAGASGNWATAQTVTVSAAQDSDTKDERLMILIGTRGGETRLSGPVGGAGKSMAGVSVIVDDDDASPVADTPERPVGSLRALGGHVNRAYAPSQGVRKHFWNAGFWWDAPSGGGTVSGYDLEWRKRGQSWSEAARLDTTQTSVTVRLGNDPENTGSFREGDVLEYQVRAKGSFGRGSWTSGSLTLSSPSNLVTLRVSPGDGKLDLDWDAPDWTTGGYNVWYTSVSNPDRFVGRASHPVNGWADAGHTGTSTSHTIDNLDNGTPYWVRIRLADDPNYPGGHRWTQASGTPAAASGYDPGGGGLPAAVELALEPDSVGEGAGTVAVTATLDAPAPADGGGISLRLYAGAGSTAERGADYAMPRAIEIAAGQRSGTASVTIVDDGLTEGAETVEVSVIGAFGDADLQDTVVLTITDNDAPSREQTAREQTAQEQTAQGRHDDLIAQMYEWRNDPQWSSYKSHTDRWDRALLAFGETVADQTLTPMTAAEAQEYADESWGTRWVPVAKALKEIESAGQQAQPNQAGDGNGNTVSDAFDVTVAKKHAALIAQMRQWRNDPQWSGYKSHTDRWDRALLALGETVADTSLTSMTAAEAQAFADTNWGTRWVPVAKALKEIENS